METPAGYVVTYISGNKTAVLGPKKPEKHEIMHSIEPFYLGHSPVLPADTSMVPHIVASYIAGYHHGKTDRSFMPTRATMDRVARIGAEAYMKGKGVGASEKAPQNIDWVAAAEHLAFTIHGVQMAELSDDEKANCHRWVRSTINAALHLKA